jgi:hypothetical protein
MEYEVALLKAWSDFKDIAKDKSVSVRFLTDDYAVDLEKKRILSLSCNVPAKTPLSILILHYLLQKFKGLPPLKGEWISFKEL